jgi:thiamine-monophosphate kinase
MGARIHAQQIPYVAVAGEVRNLGLDALGLALDGGEDYALLFTVPQRWAARIPRSLRGTKLTRIGEIVRGRGLTLVAADGTSSPLEPGGWDHFRPGTRRNRKEGFLTRKAGSE